MSATLIAVVLGGLTVGVLAAWFLGVLRLDNLAKFEETGVDSHSGDCA